MRTFKEHFLRILAGVADSFLLSMWNYLVKQTVITLNLLRQSRIHPHLSAWEHWNRTFNCNTAPIGQLGCHALMHEPVKIRYSWGYHTLPGYCIGPALHHYRCFRVFPTKTRSPRTSKTVEFRHQSITAPEVTPVGKVIDAISKLRKELALTPSPQSDHQSQAINSIKSLFTKCNDRIKPTQQKLPDSTNEISSSNSNQTKPKDLSTNITKPLPKVTSSNPKVSTSLPWVPMKTKTINLPKLSSIASRTRSSTINSTDISSPIASRARSKFQANSCAAIPTSTLMTKINQYFELSTISSENSPPNIANAALDADFHTMLEYRQLIHHPNSKIQKIWTTSAADEFGRLF